MNAEQFLNEALGGNMNISTLKPLAWHEIMESYAQHKIKEEKFTSTNSQSTQLKIGKYELYQSPYQAESISIVCDDGEGGDFSKESFFKVLNKFYNDNF